MFEIYICQTDGGKYSFLDISDGSMFVSFGYYDSIPGRDSNLTICICIDSSEKNRIQRETDRGKKQSSGIWIYHSRCNWNVFDGDEDCILEYASGMENISRVQ